MLNLIRQFFRRRRSRVKTTFVKLPLETKPETTVKVAEADGLLLFEGDIAVRRPPPVGPLAIGIDGTSFRWPNATIPFEIASGNSADIQSAIAHWQQKTKIRFVLHTTEPDFVIFELSNRGSDSEVGRRGNSQTIHVFANASVGEIIHEIGHCVGLWHEHSRSDRDTFITIDLNNVLFGAEINFDQHISDGDDLGSYDYGSIMHYGPFEFAINKTKPTITPKKSGVTIGQRIGLSAGDIAAVADLYP